jgi:hypothetical protein
MLPNCGALNPGAIPSTLYFIIDGNQVERIGKNINTTKDIPSTKSITPVPLKTSVSGTFVVALTTYAFIPTGGVTKPISANLTEMTPNHMGS